MGPVVSGDVILQHIFMVIDCAGKEKELGFSAMGIDDIVRSLSIEIFLQLETSMRDDFMSCYEVLEFFIDCCGFRGQGLLSYGIIGV